MPNYLLLIILVSGLFFSCSSDRKTPEALYAENIREVLQTLAFEKIDECYPGNQSWPQASLLKKSIDIEYKFSDDCNLKGKFTASYLDEIPMQFQVKNVDDFDRASLLVKMHINQHRSGVIYGFEVKQGSIMGKGKQVSFTARYKVDTDPLTNEIKQDTEKGEINILVPGTKKIKQSVPFTFH